MDLGALAFAGIAALAGVLLLASFGRARATQRALAAAGFERCDGEIPALLRALDEVAGGSPPAPRRTYQIGRAWKRAAGWGFLYHLAVSDRTHADADPDRNLTGARFDVFLLDPPDASRLASPPLSLVLAPRAGRVLQLALAQLVKASPLGVALELGEAPRARAFLAAWSDRPGKLDERLPAATQERLARASELGFHAVHFGAGKLALEAFPDSKQIERQLAYLSEWA